MPFPTSGVSFVFQEPTGLVERTGYLDGTGQFTWQLTRNNRGSLTLPLQVGPGDTFAPKCGWPVWIYENYRNLEIQSCVWLGSISGVEAHFNAGNSGQHQFTVTGITAERFFDGIPTPVVEFNSVHAGDIFSYLAQYAIDLGLPVAITLGAIDPGVAISNRKFDGKTSVGAELQKLATDSAFVQYVDPRNQQINFQAPNAVTGFTVSNDLITGRGMIRFGTLAWKQSDADFRDKQVVQLNPDVVPPEVTVFTSGGLSYTLPKAATQVIGAALVQGTVGVQASTVGTFASNPNPGDAIAIGANQYVFRAALDNAKYGEVLIGANSGVTCQNLVASINGDAGRGVAYSSPSWANQYVTAEVSGSTFTLTCKFLGDIGNTVQTVSDNANVTFPGPFLTSGIPVGGVSLRVGPSDTGSYDVTYTPGSKVITLLNPPATGTSLVITYRSYGSDAITLSNGQAAVLGLASNFSVRRSGASTLTAALAEGQSSLAAYSKLPAILTYELADEVTSEKHQTIGMGQTIPHSNITSPAEAAGLVEGDWIVQSITARIPEERWEKLAEPYGHFRYSLEFVNTLDVSTYQDTFNQLATTPTQTIPTTVQPQIASGVGTGGGGSTSGGFTPFMRDALLKDLTVGDDVIDSVLVTTPITALTSPPTHAVMHGVRIAAVVRTGITLTADLTVRFKKITVTSPVTSMSWTVTVPSGWAPDMPIEWTITGSFFDLDILSLDILASDGQKDANGVASFFIEWD